MANTHKLISSVTVGSGGAANITFSSIPGTYTDLVLRLSLRGAVNGTWADTLLKFNGSTANFTNKYMYGNGSGVYPGSNAYSTSGGYMSGSPGATGTANTFNNTTVYISDYASTAKNKTYMTDGSAETNATTAYLHALYGLWSDTSAITSISLVTDTGTNWVENSTAYLYGISKS